MVLTADLCVVHDNTQGEILINHTFPSLQYRQLGRGYDLLATLDLSLLDLLHSHRLLRKHQVEIPPSSCEARLDNIFKRLWRQHTLQLDTFDFRYIGWDKDQDLACLFGTIVPHPWTHDTKSKKTRRRSGSLKKSIDFDQEWFQLAKQSREQPQVLQVLVQSFSKEKPKLSPTGSPTPLIAKRGSFDAFSGSVQVLEPLDDQIVFDPETGLRTRVDAAVSFHWTVERNTYQPAAPLEPLSPGLLKIDQHTILLPETLVPLPRKALEATKFSDDPDYVKTMLVHLSIIPTREEAQFGIDMIDKAFATAEMDPEPDNLSHKTGVPSWIPASNATNP